MTLSVALMFILTMSPPPGLRVNYTTEEKNLLFEEIHRNFEKKNVSYCWKRNRENENENMKENVKKIRI